MVGDTILVDDGEQVLGVWCDRYAWVVWCLEIDFVVSSEHFATRLRFQVLFLYVATLVVKQTVRIPTPRYCSHQNTTEVISKRLTLSHSCATSR